MAVLPDKIQERIAWFEQRMQLWEDNREQIGITAAQVESIKTDVEAARAKYDAAQEARNNSKSATLSMRDAVREMSRFGSDLIKTIRAFAETSGNNNVFVLANVPAPADPTPAGPPTPPTDVVADPNADGTVTLKWKGSVASGTFFSIWRQVGNGAFVQIGAVAGKTFLDVSVPAGVASVGYYVRAQRGPDTSSPSSETTVHFGAGGAGGVALRIAA